MYSNEILLQNLKQKCLDEINDELSKQATNMVFGKGSPNAPILFIGEAPGEKEDLEGIPFIGRSGKELDKQLQEIGLTLDECYIANILKYQPPKNRDPNKEEIIGHTPYLIEQIKIIKPKIIATLGNFSTKFVLGGFTQENMKKIQGVKELQGKMQKIEYEGHEFVVVPIYHPAAMLYRPKLREDFAQSFQNMKQIIEDTL